ncbi:unnamed protein product, partial [Rotaria magnacalcarata]
MEWKEKDDLSWCCVSRRQKDDDDDDDDDIQHANMQIAKVVLMERSTEELLLPVEKLTTPSKMMETSRNYQGSKENLSNMNGNRYQTPTKQLSARLDRSLSRTKDDSEANIIRSNTT